MGNPPCQSGIRVAKEVCRDFANLEKSDIESALLIPDKITVHERWPIRHLLNDSYKYAKHFINECT